MSKKRLFFAVALVGMLVSGCNSSSGVNWYKYSG